MQEKLEKISFSSKFWDNFFITPIELNLIGEYNRLNVNCKVQIWANCEIEKNEIAFRMSIYFTRKEGMLKVLRFFFRPKSCHCLARLWVCYRVRARFFKFNG